MRFSRKSLTDFTSPLPGKAGAGRDGRVFIATFNLGGDRQYVNRLASISHACFQGG
jgi:hypothetical protein